MSLVQLVHAALVSASWSVVAVTRRDNISAAALGSWVAAVSAAQLLGAAVGAQLGPRSSLNTLRTVGKIIFGKCCSTAAFLVPCCQFSEFSLVFAHFGH